MLQLRTVPVHLSLHRHSSIMGCDRTLFLLAVALALVLPVTQYSLIAVVWGVCIWPVSIFVLRKLFTADPLFFPIYMRSQRYRHYYPPRTSVWAPKKK